MLVAYNNGCKSEAARFRDGLVAIVSEHSSRACGSSTAIHTLRIANSVVAVVARNFAKSTWIFSVTSGNRKYPQIPTIKTDATITSLI
jgi:hypothetical protein